MIDELPGASQLRAEIDAMSTAQLLDAARTGQWPVHPLHLRLDTAERLAAAQLAVADLERPRGAPAPRASGPAIAARRLEALARGWERLGGGREFLFHVRGERRPGEDRPLGRADLAAPRIAIDPNPGVPAAPCLEHPISLAEAARFAIVLPVMRCCTALGEAAARAFDGLGQPTAAQDQQASRQLAPPRRRPVWRLSSPVRSARSQVGMAVLTIVHLFDDLGGYPERERIGVSAARVHPEGWSELETAVIGELAWRLACERDARVQAARVSVGHRVLVGPAVVGRRYRELDDPFACLLAILGLGCRLHAFSREATTFELSAPASA